MTIKELKVKFPPKEHRWSAVHQGEFNDDYQDDDKVLSVQFTKNGCLVVYWEKAKPAPKHLSKAKLDKVIELNRKYFSAPLDSVERSHAIRSLRKAKKDCGEEIYDTGLLDIVRTIILSTKERNTPNETIYKVYEALGYTLVD